ncbi:MAG: hypothetical protein JJW00_02525 [Sulfurimonas sp.]|nr:hypothetical protein [Sulfurimonas sp.]
MSIFKKLIVALFLLGYGTSELNASELSAYFSSVNNSEYNLVIAPVLVTNKRAKKSRIAIKRGYRDQIKKLTRVIVAKELQANIVTPKKYARKNHYEKLVTLELDKLNETLLFEYNKINKEEKTVESEEDDDFADFSESDFEDVNSEKEEKNELELLAENTLFKVSNIYLEKEVQMVTDIKVTLRDANGKIVKMVNPDSVFLESFTPYDKKRVYFVDVRIFLVILNSTANTITIMTKEIVNAEFDNNAALITGKTGQVLRELLSEALNVQI